MKQEIQKWYADIYQYASAAHSLISVFRIADQNVDQPLTCRRIDQNREYVNGNIPCFLKNPEQQLGRVIEVIDVVGDVAFRPDSCGRVQCVKDIGIGKPARQAIRGVLCCQGTNKIFAAINFDLLGIVLVMHVDISNSAKEFDCG